MKTILFFTLFAIPSYAFNGIESTDPATVIDTCKVPSPKKFVYVFQQWHLPPSEKSEVTTGRFPEQEENQTAIYQILDKWIAQQNIKTIFAEGCEGEITSSFSKKYNGWDYSTLKKEVKNANYARITSHIPLKLEVKYTDKLNSLCGDDSTLIEKGNLLFSDLRGFSGFLGRIQQLKDKPDQQRSYTKLATEVLKISSDTPTDKIIQKLKESIQDRVSQVRASLAERNKAFIKNILKDKDSSSALVIGGAHLPDLKNQLEQEGIGCQIIKPRGYNFDPEAMYKALSGL